jgi:uncharacterized protein (TIGR00251 family)
MHCGRSKGTFVDGHGSDRAGFHRWIGEDLELRVHAVPGAKRTGAQGLHGSALKVKLHAPAIEGAANSALIEFLARELQVSRRQCALVSGDKAREKRVLVQRPARARAEEVLRAWAQGRTSS